MTGAGYGDTYILKLDNGGNYIWAKRYGSTGADWPDAISVDASGNILVCGFFYGTVDFDPGAGNFSLTAASTSAYDACLLKLNAAGDFQWAMRFGGPSSDVISDVLSDAAGNVYAAGYFSGTAVDFNPGPGVFNMDSILRNDAFLMKLSPSGSLIWAKDLTANSASGNEGATDMAFDPAGNICVTGYFDSTADFDPGPGNLTMATQGQYDVFISKLDTGGNLLWAKAFGGKNRSTPEGIAIDRTGAIFISGDFSDTLDFDPGPGTSFAISRDNSSDVFVTKLDGAGNHIWGTSFGGADYDLNEAIALSGSGAIYLVGEFRDTCDFDPEAGTNLQVSRGDYDGYLMKLRDRHISTVGIAQSPILPAIRLYPNPTAGTATLGSDVTLSNPVFRLQNISGHLLREWRPGSGSTFGISLQDYPPGVYMLNVDDATSGAQHFRLIRQ